MVFKRHMGQNGGPLWLRWFIVSVLFIFLSPLMAKGVYQSNSAFLQSVFGQDLPAVQVLWQKGELKKQVTKILGHRYPALRIKYWATPKKSAWILEEIGKDKPITVGLVVADNRVEKLRILAFRESRGGEIRYDYFTRQFKQVGLTSEQKLDNHIDAITGATLSVRAVKKIARLALYLDQQR